MCGIFAILNSNDDVTSLRNKTLRLSRRLRHRGPDWNGVSINKSQKNPQKLFALAHERLAIVDLENGAQPLHDIHKHITLSVNGEIYNHQQIRDEICRQDSFKYEFQTLSDCESIIPLYLKHGLDFLHLLDGIFAFVLYDARNDFYMAARDPIGVCSLYIGWHRNGSIWVASEMKALEECTLVKEFPAGSYFSSKSTEFIKWYNPKTLSESYIPQGPVDLVKLRACLEQSVVKRLMTDVPFGVLLSGGLDSSIIASIASKYLDKVNRSASNIGFSPTSLITFSIGLEGSPDLEWAAKVAKFIGSNHQSFVFTVQEGIDALEDVINYIETYDVTTVRASTPMFLMARRIKAMGIKMVLSGEGSDEIFGGYLYFHKAPTPEDFHKELVRKISALSKYDCLRANKATAAWGVEARVPFLDKTFIECAMNIDAKDKMITSDRIEKYILRKAFDCEENPFLPKEVLWRQKEQFSDGVGYNWIDSLKEYANSRITDEQIAMAPVIYPYNTPLTKEAYLYRNIFESFFSKDTHAKTVPSGASIACSTSAALAWDKNWANIADPSGRSILGIHGQSLLK